jgi:DNA-binding transcriptional ArsR family regulator
VKLGPRLRVVARLRWRGVAVLVSTRIGLQRRHVVTASTHQRYQLAGTTASCQRSSVGEEISGELAAVLDLSESTVSHHLSQLRKAGLVISDRPRMQVFHRVRPDALQALGAALDPNCCT